MLARLRLTASLLFLVLLLSTTTSCRRRTAHKPAETAPQSSASAPPSSGPILTTTTTTTDPPVSTAAADDKSASQMSEAERKAAARAAFAEGVQLQEHRDCAQALPRFEAAERLFDAPTHVLRIAQCQALMGRLVEAQESFSTLAHMTLPPGAPHAFREAKEKAGAELARLAPRVPTLRVETSPGAASLKNIVVKVNGTQMPADLIGVARPLNPGRYRVTVTASPNRTGTGEMELKEGDAKSLEVKLSP